MLIRSATPEDHQQIGELAARVYLAEGYTRAGSHYPRCCGTRQPGPRKAELMVAADEGGRLLGPITYALELTPPPR